MLYTWNLPEHWRSLCCCCCYASFVVGLRCPPFDDDDDDYIVAAGGGGWRGLLCSCQVMSRPCLLVGCCRPWLQKQKKNNFWCRHWNNGDRLKNPPKNYLKKLTFHTGEPQLMIWGFTTQKIMQFNNWKMWKGVVASLSKLSGRKANTYGRGCVPLNVPKAPKHHDQMKILKHAF